MVSMPPMWAWNRSLRSIDWRRSLESKFSPPVVNPPPRRISSIPSDICSTDTGNRSRSQPSRSSPALASIEPKMPLANAAATSWWKSWPDSVAWLTSMLTLTSFSSPYAGQERVHRRDVVVVLVLRRLERLRLDQDRALEPDRVLVLDDHVEEPAELVDLAAACRC